MVYFNATTRFEQKSGWLSRYTNKLQAGRPGFDSQQRKIFLFSTASRQALGPTQPPIQWVPGSFKGCKAGGG
jgi:hypothetical protein